MLIQYQSMLSCGHNGVILMDTTFDTNDMKLHLFTLMGFDTWVNAQYNDLIVTKNTFPISPYKIL
jgi:5'(3')-deoxyribonucleotidase